jgi:hypothetical protein
LFGEHCNGCHHADGSSEAPVALEQIGTNPALGNSPARGTGSYRIPSLWSVADRGQLLHDGIVPDLAAFFDPARPASVPGHRFGLELVPADRAALLDFVRSIGQIR